MKEITAGYAPPASEETGIRYPCPPTSLEACGKGIFKNYEDAVEAVNMANHVNPGIKHWVEEVV